MTASNLICQYTLPDDVVLTAEFICGDNPPTQDDPDAIIRCDESVLDDFDCDDVDAVADRMLREAVEKTNGRFPYFDGAHDSIVEWLMNIEPTPLSKRTKQIKKAESRRTRFPRVSSRQGISHRVIVSAIQLPNLARSLRT